MTVKEILSCARKLLDASHIDDASLEGELLFRQAIGLSRAQLYSTLEHEIDPEQEAAFRQMVRLRLDGKPSAYIIGRREFYGLDFIVDPNVLIPRPESELLVEKTLSLAGNRKTPVIADIGTGCGAIAISLAVNLPRARIYATDISATALEVAAVNCRKHEVVDRIRLLCGNILEPLPEPVDFIVANLPYVKLSDIDDRCHEPLLALDGGADGLEKIKRLIHQVEGNLNPGGCLLLEMGLGQREAIISLLHRLFPTAGLEVTPDLSGIDRMVSMLLPC
ncbi:MAG: peptide chain release factor N(5)-glutamine methyltransferase [Dehalococcoidales bacterium]|nr:peptide chain release factor N(5)-glutamine methyltransferase [Dehalococcoidales bacterium]